jgi:hypothetical protein
VGTSWRRVRDLAREEVSWGGRLVPGGGEASGARGGRAASGRRAARGAGMARGGQACSARGLGARLEWVSWGKAGQAGAWQARARTARVSCRMRWRPGGVKRCGEKLAGEVERAGGLEREAGRGVEQAGGGAAAWPGELGRSAWG